VRIIRAFRATPAQASRVGPDLVNAMLLRRWPVRGDSGRVAYNYFGHMLKESARGWTIFLSSF